MGRLDIRWNDRTGEYVVSIYDHPKDLPIPDRICTPRHKCDPLAAPLFAGASIGALGRAREIVLLGKAYHGLQPNERRTGKAAKLVDLYARTNSVTST
jgi:hypothetical protein